MNEENKFYFQGKYFENQEDFWEYVNKWPKEKLDLDTAKRLFMGLQKDVCMNLLLFEEHNFTNAEFSKMMHETFLSIIEKIFKSRYKKNDK